MNTERKSLVAGSFRDPEKGASDTGFHVHLGRSWVGQTLEADCPCGKAACGLVDSEQIDPACPQHALDAARTMRQAHYATACPVPHEPDEMGIHSDDGVVWLPKSRYTRSQALTWYAAFTGISLRKRGRCDPGGRARPGRETRPRCRTQAGRRRRVRDPGHGDPVCLVQGSVAGVE